MKKIGLGLCVTSLLFSTFSFAAESSPNQAKEKTYFDFTGIKDKDTVQDPITHQVVTVKMLPGAITLVDPQHPTTVMRTFKDPRIEETLKTLTGTVPSNTQYIFSTKPPVKLPKNTVGLSPLPDGGTLVSYRAESLQKNLPKTLAEFNRQIQAYQNLINQTHFPMSTTVTAIPRINGQLLYYANGHLNPAAIAIIKKEDGANFNMRLYPPEVQMYVADGG